MTTDERDVLEELGALLDVEPSAAFAAQVRQAIERDTPRGVSWRLMAVVGMGAAIAGVVVATAVRQQAPAATPPGRVISSAAGPAPEAPPAAAPRARDVAAPAAATKPRARVTVERIADSAPVVTTMDGIQVIIPADQRLALARLVAGIRGGRVIVPSGLLPQYDQDGWLLPIAPVVIAAIPDPVAPIDANDSNGGLIKSPGEKR